MNIMITTLVLINLFISVVNLWVSWKLLHKGSEPVKQITPPTIRRSSKWPV